MERGAAARSGRRATTRISNDGLARGVTAGTDALAVNEDM